MRQAGILLKVRDFLVEREREPGSYLMVGTASDDEGESEFAVEFVREGDMAWCELVSRARIRNESKIRSA